ncbi:MAG TPA: hypothetical protein VFH61_05500, partial [Thermoleophilia bacterium]|nr:hypothetical protein [Thermoleophilia bacterium]
MQPRTIALSDAAHTIALGEIDTNVMGRIDPNNPGRLIYTDVLGPGSGVDIELVVERAALHQNIVFRNKPALPEAFDEDNARVYVYTELSLDAFASDPDIDVKLGSETINVLTANDLTTARDVQTPISFVVKDEVDGETTEAVLHQFVESKVWDSAPQRNETVAARQLWRDPRDQRTYLVESVPYTFVADATGAVTIDYQNVSGTIATDQMWTANITYQVVSDVNIGEGVTLTIEPGTVVKFDTGSINVTNNGAAIIARGEPYRYIVFTSKEDDQSGEDLTPGVGTSGAAGQYS